MKIIAYSFFFLALLAVSTHAAHAQQAGALRTGFVDFSSIERLFDDEPVVEVNIKGALLSLAVEATKREDPELSQLLGRLQGVYVRGYDVRNLSIKAIEEQTRALGRRLEQEGWETVARVREEGERVHVYLRTDGKTISGLTVMTLDQDDQAIFVNIVGDIDPAQIGRIGRKFNVPSLEKL